MGDSIQSFIQAIKTNKLLVICWVLSLFTLVILYSFNKSTLSTLPGITEAKENIFNFSEAVQIKKTHVGSGQFVKKGDLLFEVEKPDLGLREKENRANLIKLVVEMNVLQSKERSVEEWKAYVEEKKENDKNLSPLELEFISFAAIDDHIQQAKSNLKVVAQVDGHVGEFFFNIGETVPPYTKILSLYESHPHFVQSYIPENYDLTKFTDNRQTEVTSMNRNHRVTGRVVSIGTLLIALPQRFQKNPMETLFGREIRIALPEQNKFYLGEKVFVKLGQ